MPIFGRVVKVEQTGSFPSLCKGAGELAIPNHDARSKGAHDVVAVARPHAASSVFALRTHWVTHGASLWSLQQGSSVSLATAKKVVAVKSDPQFGPEASKRTRWI